MSEILIRGGHTPTGIADILIFDNRIKAISEHTDRTSDLTPNLASKTTSETTVIDASGMVVWPGLINTHHHLAQSVLKGVPAGIQNGLDDWLPAVPFAAWPHITPETLYTAARIGFAELLRSGCTTCVDHHYLYSSETEPALEQALFTAAEEVGIRFVLARGGATNAGSHAGQKAGRRTETIDLCLTRLQETVSTRHDSNPFSMSRVVIAPTSLVHSASPADLKLLAEFAREHGLKMHSHLLEVARDDDIAKAQYGMSAIDYAQAVGWLGEDVWFAHLVFCDAHAIEKLGATRTGVSHCPTSNCRLGSGIAPIPAMVDAGMQISIGVDGSGSAESGSMMNELMQAWLLHRAVQGADATKVSDVLAWSTQDAAALLGLDTGSLAVGQAADLVIFDITEPRFLGVWQPAEAPLICGEPVTAAYVMVNGKMVVEQGHVLGIDYQSLREDAARETSRLQRLMQLTH